ncbi:LLM class flavin-dependent oxidoreductase [Nocardia sp. NBC_00508]|uniref:LLM class flavin-dependent oxidoreductase n=1 Tax=Nocardia sp. NBC_00508 TaxID=2975992 RepID=UPI002E81A722|nr:LLM class flavin-dependent oxidoreductase [Nocardia sp. NBC_00508]WUD67080.1 LLM class flavin-dependent oxidoreductase [Nocardia sp. NBC_00508]
MYSEDWRRVQAGDWSQPPSPPDYVKWDEVLDLGDRIEPLGFDSIWSVEHFATPYGMVPNSLQHLAFWAGRTERVDLGTSVIVLPWHHPVQVAHEIAFLDILLQGRNYTIGVGRGLSPKEFGPLGIPQEQARQRFVESLDVIRLGLTQERFSYDGEIFKIPETSIRPQPRHGDLWSNALGGFMTETSLEAVAKAGLGAIVVSPQSFDKVAQNMMLFNQIRQQNGLSPDSQPMVLLWAYCVERPEEAAIARKYFARFERDGALHYGFADPTAFENISGYEQYAEMMKQPDSGSTGFVPGGGAEVAEHNAADNQLIGTPDEIIEKVEYMQRTTGAREIAVNFNFGGMPHDLCVKSMQLFAAEVLPAIREMPTDRK